MLNIEKQGFPIYSKIVIDSSIKGDKQFKTASKKRNVKKIKLNLLKKVNFLKKLE